MTENKPTPWQILGVDVGSTEQEIESAFLIKAKEYHPDHNGDPEKFMEVVSAKNQLLHILNIKTFSNLAPGNTVEIDGQTLFVESVEKEPDNGDSFTVTHVTITRINPNQLEE